MICNSCGRSLKDTAKFCSGCGGATGNGYAGSSGVSDFGASLQLSAPALFVEPPLPQQVYSVTCASHPATVATGTCVGCGNFYCRDCLTGNGEVAYCGKCSAPQEVSLSQGLQLYQDSQAVSSPAVATGLPVQYYPPAEPDYRFAGLSPYYQHEFNQIAASGESYKGKWNWAAFFFGGLWAITKGAWATFLVHVAINLVVVGATCGVGFPVIFVFPILYGLRGNYIYYSVVAKKKQIVF